MNGLDMFWGRGGCNDHPIKVSVSMASTPTVVPMRYPLPQPGAYLARPAPAAPTKETPWLVLLFSTGLLYALLRRTT